MDAPQSLRPSLTHRLGARSVPRVVQLLESVVSRLGAAGWKFRARKYSSEAALNSLVLWLVTQPVSVQDEILSAGLRLYESHLAGDLDFDVNSPASPSSRSSTHPGAAPVPFVDVPPSSGLPSRKRRRSV